MFFSEIYELIDASYYDSCNADNTSKYMLNGVNLTYNSVNKCYSVVNPTKKSTVGISMNFPLKTKVNTFHMECKINCTQRNPSNGGYQIILLAANENNPNRNVIKGNGVGSHSTRACIIIYTGSGVQYPLNHKSSLMNTNTWYKLSLDYDGENVTGTIYNLDGSIFLQGTSPACFEDVELDFGLNIQFCPSTHLFKDLIINYT